MSKASVLFEYGRLIKPRIILLLNLVSMASLLTGYYTGAVSTVPTGSILNLLVAGSLAAAGASSFNSYYDRDLDSLMPRTKKRPLPSGKIPPRGALVFSVLLTLLSFAYSVLFLKPTATLFIVLGFVTYVFIYTVWLKRRSSWNIVIGGFAGSCASLAGWAEATGTIPTPAALMAITVFLWTPSHFWSLAIRSSSGYRATGVPMLPQVVGAKKASQIIVANTLILIASTLLLYVLAGLGWAYLAVAMGLGGMLLFFNVRTMLEPSDQRAFAAFKASSPYLAVLFVVITLDAALHL